MNWSKELSEVVSDRVEQLLSTINPTRFPEIASALGDLFDKPLPEPATASRMKDWLRSLSSDELQSLVDRDWSNQSLFHSPCSGFIRRDGSWLLEPGFDSCDDFQNGFAKAEKDGLWGFVRKDGSWVAPPHPDGDESAGFAEGLAPWPKDGRWGYINEDGAWVVEPRLRWANEFCNGLAVAESEDGKLGFVDATGDWVIRPTFDHVRHFCGKEALALASDAGRYGFINQAGKWVIPPKFEDGWPFSEECAAVKFNGCWGFIDVSGAWCIRPQFEYACPFEDGIAAVERDGRWGVIDTEGTWRIYPVYESESSLNFHGGLSAVEIDGMYGCIDTGGQWVIEPSLQWMGWFSEGLAPAQQGGLFGFIDKTGRWSISPQFEDANSFSADRAPAKLHGSWGFIDKAGNWIISPQFDLVCEFEDASTDGDTETVAVVGYAAPADNVNKIADILLFERNEIERRSTDVEGAKQEQKAATSHTEDTDRIMTFAIRNDVYLEPSPPVFEKDTAYDGETVSSTLLFIESGGYWVAAGKLLGPDADGLHFFDSGCVRSRRVAGPRGQEIPVWIQVAVNCGHWAIGVFRSSEDIPTEKTASLPVLTAAMAKTLLSQEGQSLRYFRDIDDEAAQLLAAGEDDLYLDGLQQLSANAATILATHPAVLSFAAVTSLDVSTAKALAKHRGLLYLDGLRRLSPEVALALRSHSGRVSLRGLKEIDSHEGLEFAVKSGFDIYQLTELNSETARAIVEHASGSAIALGLTELSPDVAEVLASHKGDLTLDDVESLSDDAAAQLGSHQGSLSLERVRCISQSAAESLGNHRGSLVMGLDDLALSETSAKALSGNDGPLILRITRLDVPAAEHLSAIGAPLRLESLDVQSPELARAFSRHKGELGLGNAEISDEVAFELSKHRGSLVLDELKSMSVQAAKSLSHHHGDISLRNICLTRGVAQLLLQSAYFVALPFATGQDSCRTGEETSMTTNVGLSTCPYCRSELKSAKARQCFSCGMDWHDPDNVVQHGAPD